jgi:hypothetical protein
VVGCARAVQEVQPGQEADVRVLPGQLAEAVEELRGATLMFGFIAILPEDLLGLLQRVNAGEHPLDVFAEVTMESDRVDKDGDDDAV